MQGSNVGSLTLERGTLLATQFQGRGDGCDGLIDGLNFDCISSAVSTRPDPLSEASEDDGLVEGGFFCEGGGSIARGSVGTPFAPIFVATLGSLMSDSIGNCSPSKQEITRQLNFFGTLNSCQDLCCGRGKWELK